MFGKNAIFWRAVNTLFWIFFTAAPSEKSLQRPLPRPLTEENRVAPLKPFRLTKEETALL